MNNCKDVVNVNSISNCYKLQIISLNFTNISDISFLENNKNIKELNLRECENIKDYSFISHLEKRKNLSIKK